MGDVHVHKARRPSKEIQRQRSLLEKLRDNKSLLVDGNANDNRTGVTPEDDSIPLTLQEREFLTETIPKLPSDKFHGLVQIIREALKLTGEEDEMTLEMDQFDALTQRKLFCYVTKYVKPKQAAMRLMIEHESEFPFNLRPSIRKAASCWSNDPTIFLSEVYKTFRAFFLGQSFGRETDSNPKASESQSQSQSDSDSDTDSDTDTELPIEWHGLDSDVDTEDQVEVALRFFPRLLKELLLRTPRSNWNPLIPWRTVHHEVSPMEVLFSQARAISFLPLFLTVHKELDLPLPMFLVAKQLLVPGKATFAKLYGTAYARALFGSHPRTTEKELERLDNESLLALVRIREMGLWKVENDADSLLKWLLSNAEHRERGFIEVRLRLLIDWKPSMLRDLRRTTTPPPDEVHPRPLLGLFSSYFSMVDDETYRLGIFETMVDLGMSHFPMELGFVFHSDILPSFTERHGKEPIVKIVHDRLQRLLRSLGHNNDHNTLQSLVIAVATNDRIRLDGLYALLRSDPAGLIPHYCHGNKRTRSSTHFHAFSESPAKK